MANSTLDGEKPVTSAGLAIQAGTWQRVAISSAWVSLRRNRMTAPETGRPLIQAQATTGPEIPIPRFSSLLTA
jgi:hypothetical protein